MHLGINSIMDADKTVLYPTAWAMRLGNTHTLSLELVRPSPSSIKGDALSPNKVG